MDCELPLHVSPCAVLPNSLGSVFSHQYFRIGGLAAGAVTNVNAEGWRYIYWMQAAFHGTTSLGLFFFYWPAKNHEYSHMRVKDYIWACDPIGSFLFVSGATLTLLALNWAGGAYAWSDPIVAGPLASGLALLVMFAGYGECSIEQGEKSHGPFR